MNDTSSGLIRGSLMIAASLITAGAISLVTSIVLARAVGATEFGVYSITTSTQGVVAILSSFGIGAAVVKFVAEYRVRDARYALGFAKAGVKLVMVFSIATTIVYFALADPIGKGLYDEPKVSELIPFSAMAVFSGALLALTSGMVQGNQQMKLLASMQILAPLISLSIVISFLPQVGVKIAFIGIFVAQLIVSLIALYCLHRIGFSLGPKHESAVGMGYFRRLLSYAVPTVISTIMVGPVYWLGNTVLALEAGFRAVGLFAAAMVFFGALSMLQNSIVTPLVPRVSEMTVRARDQITLLTSKSLRAVCVLFFPLFFGIALFSKMIVGLLYGTDYSDSAIPVYLLVTACYYSAMASIVGAVIAGLGRMWVGLGLNMIWAAVVIALLLGMIPAYGAAGLAFAYLLSYGIHVVTSMIVSERILGLRIHRALGMAIPSIVLFAAGFWTFVVPNDLSTLLMLALWALGTALMIYLGHEEFKMALSQVFKRRPRSI